MSVDKPVRPASPEEFVFHLTPRAWGTSGNAINLTFDVPGPFEMALLEAEDDIREGRMLTDEEVRGDRA